MLNKSKFTRFLGLSFAVAGFVLVGGHYAQTNAQNRDPFSQPSWKKPQKPATSGATKSAAVKKTPPAITPVTAPAIDLRINYYKQQREAAAANGQPLPKVTSVLTLDEMAITGIFKTPRGFAAMVEATPIKLSYTIYPGEKFFDGQLVAIEENRLVFRKVVKMTNGKFISSVENKPLRQYTVQQEMQGTTPVEANSTNKTEVVDNNANQNTTTTANTSAAPTDAKKVTPTVIISPVDEMNKQPESKPEDSVKDKNKKSKKPTKVAKKS
ncbi:MAG TPA: hypothetical protein VIL74_02185 [Pyrinomonadaceae bacterium]|jgi:hypothetical protein